MKPFKKWLESVRKKSWYTYVKNHQVYVTELPDGRWLSGYGLKSQLDPSGNTDKQQVFDDVTQALKFVGYPVDILGLPKELNND